jgi:hypothetical protein
VVESRLPKPLVAGSIPVSRSKAFSIGRLPQNIFRHDVAYNRGGTYHGTAFELTPVYPCAKCGHSGLREGDVLPAARRVVLEQGRDRTN